MAEQTTIFPWPQVLIAKGSDDDAARTARRFGNPADRDCGEGDDEGRVAACGPAAAPTGTTAPPANGLFRDGRAPQVTTD